MKEMVQPPKKFEIELTIEQVEALERVVFYNRLIKLRLKGEPSGIINLVNLLEVMDCEPWVKEKYETVLVPIYRKELEKDGISQINFGNLVNAWEDILTLVEYRENNIYINPQKTEILEIFLDI
jgi:hypothetical protein